jgi:zinc protease
MNAPWLGTLGVVALGACVSAAPRETISVPTADGRLVSVDSVTAGYTVGGLHVIQRRSYVNDIVAVDLYLLGGAQQLTPATAGIEVLALRAAEYGTARYPDRESLRAMMRTGSTFIIEPTSDWTLVGFRGLADQFDSSWAVFADRVVHPTLDSSAVAVAQRRMILAARARDISPDGALVMLADSVAFAGQPYGLEVTGTEASLATLTPAALQRYVRDQFVTSRMLLVVVGSVSRATVESAVARTLGDLPRGRYVWHPPAPAPPRRSQSLTRVERRTSTNYLLGYFQGPPITSPDYPAFELATNLLGARLSNAIRGQRSLSYDARAPFLGRAIAAGGVYVSTPDPAQVLPIVRGVLDTLRTTTLRWLSMDNFVREFVTLYLADNESSAAQAGSLAAAQIYYGDYRKASAAMALLRAVNPYQVKAAAQKYIQNIPFVYLGDTAILSQR